eukprot:6207627-Pleurochrysis_carterae.AAC.1
MPCKAHESHRRLDSNLDPFSVRVPLLYGHHALLSLRSQGEGQRTPSLPSQSGRGDPCVPVRRCAHKAREEVRSLPAEMHAVGSGSPGGQ